MKSKSMAYKNSQSLLDTLAQSETWHRQAGISKELIIVTGNGTDIKKVDQLRGWAKRKLITQSMMLSLIDVCKAKGKTDQLQSYWNTYHCLSVAHTSDGLLYGKYCKNRFCTVCLCIRKAEIITKYFPILKFWKEPYFVTLTIKAVPYPRLVKVFNKMLQGLKRIIGKYRKRNQRSGAKPLRGIRSLECNFNPVKLTYNPHFHLLVEDRETAVTFVKEWCKLWTKRWALEYCQNFRKVQSLEKDLIECVKYGTKIFTEADVNNKTTIKGNAKIYVSALDNILTAMKEHRLFDRFGFNRPAETDKVRKFIPLNQYDEWIFSHQKSDWVNPETAEILTDYHPSHELIHLLQKNIDLKLQ
jgi:hypothetical protein